MAAPSKVTQIWRAFRSIFRRRFKSYLLENKYRILPAFELHGKRYYMYADQQEVPTGRQLSALAIYNEMDMRCDREYLELHCRAVEKVISNPAKIHIGYLAQMNNNLRDRLDLMVVPDFIYKLASVVYFDETESPYAYDYEYNATKIAKWKQDKHTLDFFLRTPLKDLVPFLKAQEGVSDTFTVVAQMVAETHHKLLTDILSDGE